MSSAADDRFEAAKVAFVAGLDAFLNGRFEEAEKHYLASADLLPKRASTLINLAATRLALDRPDDALRSADAALAIEPAAPDAMLHRATALLRLGRQGEALPAFDRLLDASPALVAGWLQRGQVLERLGRPLDALTAYQRACTLAPADAEAWSRVGSVQRELLRPDAAAHAFRQALALGADPELHRHYLAAVSTEAESSAAPRAYVRALFDEYADDFDHHLVEQLGYRAHRQLVDGLRALRPGPFAAALDLGCGTGLCGPLVRPWVGRLDGVDLSPNMLAKARTLGVYDRLDEADLVEHLRAADRRYDLVLAADVFIYVGDLAPVFAALQSVMDSGVFCFTAEALADAPDAFRLQASLRYAHGEGYLRALAVAHGFEVLAVQHRPVREDQRAAVDGLFIYLTVGPVR